VLNQQISALRRQLGALEAALDASEKRDKESQTKIADLGQRLNVALAQRVQELSRYRSEFFGRLREILGNRPNIRIVGDRFVFQSEVFFDVGSRPFNARGPRRTRQARRRASSISKRQIPAEIAWVLRVDGHTDVRPINARSTLELGTVVGARDLGGAVSDRSTACRPQRLVAAGFGEFQPLDPGRREEPTSALSNRNRRIELKLTERCGLTATAR
jgi:chemotaxis protein MotB